MKRLLEKCCVGRRCSRTISHTFIVRLESDRLGISDMISWAVTDSLALRQLLQFLCLNATDFFWTRFSGCGNRLGVPEKCGCKEQVFLQTTNKRLPSLWQSCPVHPQDRTTRSPTSVRQRNALSRPLFSPHTCCRSS